MPILLSWLFLAASTWAGMAALLMVALGRWPEAVFYGATAIAFGVTFFSSSPGASRG